MVSSDEQINSILVSGDNPTPTSDAIVGADGSKDTNANSDVTNDAAIHAPKIPNDEEIFTEEVLIRLENYLKELRIKAITEHKIRMNIVATLVRSSGMDNQQQEKFMKEIGKLFHPVFI